MGKRRRKKPEDLYKFKALTRDHQKGGWDWYLYRKYVLLPLLYPYCEKLAARYPDRNIWLVEDNASLHTKAAEVCAELRLDRGILKADHPSNSPDLNRIEPVWDYLKDMCDL